MVEYNNQKQIFRLVMDGLNIPYVKGQINTEWDLRQACEIIILDKSIYSEILGNFGVPKSTLTYFLNVIFPPLKCYYIKHV